MQANNNYPLHIQSSSILEQLRELLENSGFLSTRAIEGIKLLGTKHTLSDSGRKSNDSMPSISDSGFSLQLETLLRLFIFGATVNRDLAIQAVHPMKLNDWLAMGLLAEMSDGIRAQLQLMVYRNTVFSVDFTSDDRSRNHVIGVTAATQTLESLTIRRQVNSTLDIGTGTGIQAMLAARHSGKVVATDINARAVNVATFNAWLNGFDIDCRVGDMFNPVKNETFDLIISCPPFVISPDDRFHYVDSGHPGDQFLEKLITEGVHYLNEGGFFQVMCQVVQYGKKTWSERIASWIEGAGCDAWILYRNTLSPEEHARMWVPERSGTSEQIIQEWVEYYNKNGITSITSGLLTIRKNSTHENWFKVDEIPRGVGYCGHSIENRFHAHDFLDLVIDDEDLLDATLIFSADIDERQTSTDNSSTKFIIQLTKGLVYSENINDVTMSFLRQCDGKMTIGEAIVETEKLLKQKIDRHEHLNIVRELFVKGFLTLLTE